jgi:salicylate hydroxylase
VFISSEEEKVSFSNGAGITADLIIGADGIHSTIRSAIGILPEIETLPMFTLCPQAQRIRI